MSSTLLFDCTRTSLKPVMKLTEKMRIGSKVKKKYDRARTPFQRVVDSDFVPEEVKEALREKYARLNPVHLQREIIKLQDRMGTR